MDIDTVVPVLLAILLQTAMFVFWVGRLAERVIDLKADIHELKNAVVYRDVYIVEIASLKQQIEELKTRLGVRETSL